MSDPSFRDRLAQALDSARFWSIHWTPEHEGTKGLADALLPVIDAEVKRQVKAANERTDELLRQVADLDGRLRQAQAAANQRAAEEALARIEPILRHVETAEDESTTAERRMVRRIRAALAQPADQTPEDIGWPW